MLTKNLSGFFLLAFESFFASGNLTVYASKVFKKIIKMKPELTGDDVISYFSGTGENRMLAEELSKCLENQPDN